MSSRLLEMVRLDLIKIAEKIDYVTNIHAPLSEEFIVDSGFEHDDTAGKFKLKGCIIYAKHNYYGVYYFGAELPPIATRLELIRLTQTLKLIDEEI